MRLSIVAVIPLLPLVLADGAAIVTAMNGILTATQKLQNTLAPWTGNPLTLIPIVIESASLLTAINHATKVAASSANLTVLETVSIATETSLLATNVNSTLTTIIAKKKYFEAEFLEGVILLNLYAEKDATDKFAAKVVTKVPAAFQAAAKTLTAPIDASFSKAIAAYETF